MLGYLSATLGLLFSGAAGADAPDIRGRSVTVRLVDSNDKGETLGYVHIERRREHDAGYEKATVRITRNTRLLRKLPNGEVVEATVGDIRARQLMEAWFVGAVLESCPVQATAGKIVILPQNTG